MMRVCIIICEIFYKQSRYALASYPAGYKAKVCMYHVCRNFHQEKFFTNFAICSHWQSFYHVIFLSCVNDYIEDMMTFTTLPKIYSTKCFCNTKVAELSETFVEQKFSRLQVHTYMYRKKRVINLLFTKLNCHYYSLTRHKSHRDSQVTFHLSHLTDNGHIVH